MLHRHRDLWKLLNYLGGSEGRTLPEIFNPCQVFSGAVFTDKIQKFTVSKSVE